jgi:hypothetical protein
MTGTVTATEGGSTTNGISLQVKVITGQNASPIGIQQSATSATPSLSTGAGVTTGSWVYGSLIGLATITANGSTTFQSDHSSGGLQYVAMRTTSTMTGGTPVTVGGTGGTGISIVLQEILAGAGLAEDASSPAPVFANTLTVTTASFTPPAGAVLVAMVSSNGAAGVTTMTVSDTGLGLTWTEQVRQNGAGNGYTGIWTAPVAAGGQTVSGAVSPLALAAPAGDVQAIVPGLVSPLALAAPAGTPAGSGAATIAGAVAQLTLTAPAGIPAAIGGGGDDAPWHIRRRR